MGWLLTCRQAYREGIEVLYGTNVYHIQGGYLLWHLPHLLLPQRLASIKAVELLWDVHTRDYSPWDKDYPHESVPMDGYRALIEALPKTLPNLRFLYLFLKGNLLPPRIEILDPKQVGIAENLLQPIDRMVTRLGLVECHIALPLSFVEMLRHRANGGGIIPWHRKDWKPTRVWRPLPVQNPSSAVLKGYWICPGKNDLRGINRDWIAIV
jgi:hypothetical protein